MNVDLHIHTNASDGTWSRAELLEQVSSKGIGLFSVTDHDTTENSVPMIQEAEAKGIAYLPGVEVASTLRGQEYHTTCYGGDFKDLELQALLKKNRDAREVGNDETIRRLAKSEPRLDYHKYKQYSNDRSRGGWKSLNFLLDEQFISNLREFFQVFHPLGIKVEFDHPSRIIEIMQRAGGVAILAHPSAYGGGEKMERPGLQEWVGFGIQGIECYTPYNREKGDSDEYVEFCKRNRLLISGGSDCHGPFLTRELGVPQITREMVDTDALLDKGCVPNG